ncbi:MAG: HPr family phosphocarrier protein [Candidatus Neomarinimicrobiota bacterium]
MEKKEVTITNRHGLHTRPATTLVKNASGFKSDVNLIYKGIRVNAKSILGLLVLAIEPGAKVTIEANGQDEREAVEQLVALAKNKFDME